VRESVQQLRTVRAAAAKPPQIRPIAERDRAQKPMAEPEAPTPKLVDAIVTDAPEVEVVGVEDQVDEEEGRKTSEYQILPSQVLKENGEVLGPWTFARLMEALATGQVGRGDKVDFVGRGFMPVEEIEEFVRFFPSTTATTNQLSGPGQPDFADAIGSSTMLATLMKVFVQSETGVLFAERTDDEGEKHGRKELYFVTGKLHHVASSNASELLGE
jgi:hypothetical protein